LGAAKMALISALVDIAIEREMIFSPDGSLWLLIVTVLWKLSFAYNIWQSAVLYQKLPTITDQAQLANGIVHVMRMTTNIWRQTSLVVSLPILEKVLSAWEGQFPVVKPLLLGLVGTVTAMTWYVSSRETKSLQLPTRSGPDRNEGPGQRIARHGKVTLRAMSMCASAFILHAMLIPAVALKTGSWVGGIMALLEISSRVALATLLWNLRTSFASALKEISTENNKDLIISDESSIKLYEAQGGFFSKAREVLKTETLGKVAAVLIPLLVTSLRSKGILQ
jgi:hypothetical protein